MATSKILSVIIPAYNEEATIANVISKVMGSPLKEGISVEIIVVDDCSTDNTSENVHDFISKNPEAPIKYFKHEKNSGKGSAIRTGIKAATGDFIIVQDADLEYDPDEYMLLLQPMLKGFADVVYGSRFMGAYPHRTLFFWHSIGNKFLTFISNMFTNLNLTDMETGFKLFKAEYLKQVTIKENRFGFEPEVTAKIAKIKGIRIYEVGISYYGRSYAEGKKINWKDGVRAIYCIFKYNLFSK